MKNDKNEDLLDIAENLVKTYSCAKMIVTSRIHAGLPALGMQTPVVFITSNEVTSENGSFNTPGRLSGLIELFRVVNLSENGFTTNDDIFKKIRKFDGSVSFENKNDCLERKN